LQAYAHAGERRAQIVRDVVADAGDLVDERLDLAQHPVDDDGELVERVVVAARRQALAQVAGDDALDRAVDLLEPLLGTAAEQDAGDDAEAERRQQSDGERPPDDLADLPELVDVAADHQHFAVGQAVRDQAHALRLAAAIVDPDHHGLGRNIRLDPGRQAFHVTGDALAVWAEQRRAAGAARIRAPAAVHLRR